MEIKQEEVWDSIAIKWNQFRYEPDQEVLNFLKNKKGKILDAGCGSGRNFVKIKNLEFYGTDFSEGMLECAKKRAKKLDMKVQLKKSNSYNLPYEDNYFDAVLCYAVIHCVEKEENRKKTVGEIYRVLKKGGLCFISVWGRNSSRLKNKKNETLIPWTVDEKKYERYTYIFKKEELEETLKSVGFKIEKCWEDKNLNFIVKK
jgi:alkylated DNA repair protein alkB family protein 8